MPRRQNTIATFSKSAEKEAEAAFEIMDVTNSEFLEIPATVGKRHAGRQAEWPHRRLYSQRGAGNGADPVS
jgi:hypothetical protein